MGCEALALRAEKTKQMKRLPTALAIGSMPLSAIGETELVLEPTMLTEWKAVYGRIEVRDRVPARARLGGTLTALNIT